ncbi:MAG TPA: SDR family oxidoreductase [Acidimicrobiales bacterium]|nr:SDR family oxidoreductase [Acidimicrobiales bacterium]
MDVVIAGAHGKVARRLSRLLADREDRVRGIVRNPDHRDEVMADGAEPIVCDLETAPDAELDAAVAGTDAIVFAAGAGPGSGAARKHTVDYGAAKRLIGAARGTGVRRYVMVSSMGTDDPPEGDDVFAVYLRAKAQADAELRAAGLDHTIVRPGGLIDEPGTGSVRIDRHVSRGRVARDDVAAVLAAVLLEPGTIRRTFEVVGGDTPITEAVAAVEDRIPPDAGGI